MDDKVKKCPFRKTTYFWRTESSKDMQKEEFDSCIKEECMLYDSFKEKCAIGNYNNKW